MSEEKAEQEVKHMVNSVFHYWVGLLVLFMVILIAYGMTVGA
jgi:hypothetical protein